jgi:iron-sulfur cluster assembly protein
MNEIINDAEIKVSQKAAKEIRRIMEENKVSAEYGLRVGVKGGGCSGLTYSLGFDAESREGDTIIDHEGIRLYIDGKSLFYLMGTMLDFSDGLNGKGFVFNNPRATKTCGCGESFST